MKRKIVFLGLLLIFFGTFKGIRVNALENRKDMGASLVSQNFNGNVYLTFDDGPSPNNTRNIMEILDKNNIKGSFFVVGANVKKFPEIIREMDRDGMAIYPHCHNHDYRELYASKEDYFKDLSQCIISIKEASGKDLKFNFIRLPGGSDNLVSNGQVLKEIKTCILDNGKNYIDWNIDSGDACAVRVSTDKIKENIKNSIGSYRVEVVLMHDLEVKDTTCEALEDIIKNYKTLGYNFKTLREMEPWEMQYLKNIRVINR